MYDSDTRAAANTRVGTGRKRTLKNVAGRGIARKNPAPQNVVRKEAPGRNITGEKTVEEFLPAIRHLAHKIARAFGNDCIADDLVVAGVIGLLEILQKYDPGKAKLHTFAYLRIRGAMIDELRSMDWFPRSARAKARKIRQAAARFEHERGRSPDEREMALEMGMDRDKYLSTLRSCGNLSVVSIEEVSDEVEESGDGASHSHLIEGESPERLAELRELRRIVDREVGKLPERQRKTVNLYYGEDMNMREVAGALGVTEARVSQIHTEAIASLRPLMSKYFMSE